MELTDEELKIIRAKKAEYMRGYRRRNPERMRAIDQRYWLKKKSSKKEMQPNEQTIKN